MLNRLLIVWIVYAGVMGFAVGGSFVAAYQTTLPQHETSTDSEQRSLKAIWLCSPDGKTFAPQLQTSSPLRVRLDMVNYGNTLAFVHRVNLVSILCPVNGQLPQRPPYNEPDYKGFPFNNVGIVSGQTFSPEEGFSDGYVLSPQDLGEIRAGLRILHLVGTIDYFDSNRLPRQTAFCRYLYLRQPYQWGDNGSFRTDDKPDPHYEYQD